MRAIFFASFLMISLLSEVEASNMQVQFIDNPNIAKIRASEEGKLYIVDFVATYCYMCKMMDETTFSDHRVIDYMEQNYIPVKVNVDNFDGFEWKQRYNIRKLPTIMVFNSAGEPIAKYEESMGSTRMLEVLEAHNSPHNKLTNSSPYVHQNIPTTNIVKPVVATSTVSSYPTTITTNTNVSPPEPNMDSETGLFEFTVKRAHSAGYGVQIGVFAEYGNVLREVERLTKLFNSQILVNINQLKGQTVYKVIVGHFPTRQEAESLQYNMALKGTNGFIADLSVLY